eukprot:TRINITY_DN25115_c0_g1_i1.p1 TRINITY_DN25115_c0_g1~~TRINITY_DN25115_c0_g1_i1.p1  ORF type:complete len:226 (+),score=39.11 TRINITY_DN25115_c0_g1_i1:44-679(+)
MNRSSSAMPRERRKAEDDNSYTYEEYIEYYGERWGIAKWGEAGEGRPNPDDGEKFSYEEFIEFYGPKKGVTLWVEAGEKRPHPTDGVALTYEDFIFLFGAAEGAIHWRQAGARKTDFSTGELITYESFIELYGADRSNDWSLEASSLCKRPKTEDHANNTIPIAPDLIRQHFRRKIKPSKSKTDRYLESEHVTLRRDLAREQFNRRGVTVT